MRSDEEGNVIAERPGVSSKPRIVVSAHLDTVFPEGTDVSVRREGLRFNAPGISDNACGIVSLIALAREDLGIAFVERAIGRTELYVADEMLLCGTGAEITPVRSVDGRVIGDGGIGPVTQRLSEAFVAAVRARAAARKDWLTPIW